jgi:replication factor C small subunit
MAVSLWTEKYRPKTLDEYVWRDAQQRKKVEEWIADGALPHLMLSGGPGTGKTSLAWLMLLMLGIPKGDILFIPASRERKIEDIQSKIINFVGTWALGPTGIKYVLLDEADAISPLAQKMLRTEMETYSDVCRFVMTCNYPEKIIPAVKSRCQGFHFEALDQEQFLSRLMHVLTNEGVQFDDDGLMKLFSATFPDMRKCLGLAQERTVGGVLSAPDMDALTGTQDYLIEMANLFKTGRYLDARKLITSQAQVEEYVDIYRYFYRNLDLWGDTEDQKDQALLTIRKSLVNHSLVADPEINLAACCVELAHIAKI